MANDLNTTNDETGTGTLTGRTTYKVQDATCLINKVKETLPVLTYDFEGVPQETIYGLAAETLTIKLRQKMGMKGALSLIDIKTQVRKKDFAYVENSLSGWKIDVKKMMLKKESVKAQAIDAALVAQMVETMKMVGADMAKTLSQTSDIAKVAYTAYLAITATPLPEPQPQPEPKPQ